MSAPAGRLTSAPAPVRLAALCLCGQALLLVGVISQARQQSGLFLLILQVAAIPSLVVLAVTTMTRHERARRLAVWLQTLIALRALIAMFDWPWFFWGMLGLLVAGVGATQLLSDPARDWFSAQDRNPPPSDPARERFGARPR
jgi:hypothetical protein